MTDDLARRRADRAACEERVFNSPFYRRHDGTPMDYEERHPMQADLPALPIWQRAVVIVGLAAAMWCGVWIVARGIIWIARVW